MRLASAGIGDNRVQAWLAWVVEAAAASTRASGVRREAARGDPDRSQASRCTSR